MPQSAPQNELIITNLKLPSKFGLKIYNLKPCISDDLFEMVRLKINQSKIYKSVCHLCTKLQPEKVRQLAQFDKPPFWSVIL